MRENEQGLVEFPLLMLEKAGFYSSTTSKKVVVVATLCSMLLGFLDIVAVMQLSCIQGDVDILVMNCEAISGFSQVLGKVMAAGYGQKKFFKLIQYTRDFWDTTTFPYEVKIKLNRIITRTQRFQQLFTGCIFATITIACIYALFGRSLPLGIWSMTGYNDLYYIVLSLQIIIWPYLGLFMCGFDGLFLGFCVKAVVQLKMLKTCFEELHSSCCASVSNRQKYFNYVKVLVQHHVLLLRYCEALQNAYSAALLSEYLSVTVFICVEMYAILQSEDLSHLVTHGGMLFCPLLQLAFYCIPADYILSEAEEVSNAIYNSKWYSRRCSSIRNHLILIMQRSQHAASLTAGGLVEINTKTLVTVLRVSWSVCTVMRGLKGKN